MIKLIQYFANRHLFTNVLFWGIIFLAIFSWRIVGKEEMPEFASNWIRVNTSYPGAPAEDVELFVTKPIEDELKGVVGIEEIISTSSIGSSSFRIIIDDYYPDKEEVLNEIKDAVSRVKLPSEVRELPSIRQFKSSEKAILDVGLYLKGVKTLDQKSREKLQEYVLGFENQLLSLRPVSSIERNHYLKPELQILVDPNKKNKLDISLTEIVNQLRNNNIRMPVGAMQDEEESKVTAINEYETKEAFDQLVLRGNYEGDAIKLGAIADVQKGFERSTSIFKVNGHEGVFLNIRKSSSTDILTAQAAVKKLINRYKEVSPELGIAMMDDESYAVVNRLNIISNNGLVGFILIVIVLLLFLNLKTGFWVAMGIPFSMAITLLLAHLAGYTVNNMTLAAIIIVLGIVVDDAIIIAENIAVKMREGIPPLKAAIDGAHEVFRPIIASIVTTCVAFLPLLYFEGFFGKLVAFIPLIIILMLGASLVESLLILPAHLAHKTPFLDRFSKPIKKVDWFHHFENRYESIIAKVLARRNSVLAVFILLLLAAGTVFATKMKYVMFPREESTEVVVKIEAPKDVKRQKMAMLIEPIEDMVLKETENVVAVRSSIALSRRGGTVKENEASVLIELYPRDERTKPLKELLKKWEEQSKKVQGLKEVKFLKGRWGNDSGSAVEIQIQENNDKKRDQIASKLKQSLENISGINEVEIEDPMIKDEYIFKIKQDMLVRFDIDPTRLATALRTFVEGSIAYSINKGDEEVDVRVTVPNEDKSDINKLLELKVENKSNQLIDIKKLVSLEKQRRPINIQRTDFKRATRVYGDLDPKTKKTPLEIAQSLEEGIFQEISKDFPTAILSFKGEIEDSRESQGEFIYSVVMVVISIYLILVLLFDSLFKPFVILTSVPFGLAGVVVILLVHDMQVYGFFAVIGALGMIGVVVNDAIVMVDKLENAPKEDIPKVAASRLRPIVITTLTTVVGVLPTAYGLAGYDSMLAEMMLVMGWGLLLSTVVTLVLIPIFYSYARK